MKDAKSLRVPVARHIFSSFGQAVKTQMLPSNKIGDSRKTRLSSFVDGKKWARNLAGRQGHVRKALHGEVGGVDREAAKDGMEAFREDGRHHALGDIFNVHETGPFSKVIPRRMFVAGFEGPKTARGTRYGGKIS